MICNEEPDVRTQYNPDGNFTNFFYCADCSYYNDFDENCIVFTWGNGTVVENKITVAPGSAANTVVVTAVTPTAGSGETFQYRVKNSGADVADVVIGNAVPTGFSSLTVGAVGTGTAVSATKGQILEVVRVKSSKVTGYTSVKV